LLRKLFVTFHSVVKIPSISRTTSSYAHYEGKRRTKYFLRILPINMKLARTNFPWSSHNNHISTLPEEEFNKIFLTSMTCHFLLFPNISQLMSQNIHVSTLSIQMLNTFLTCMNWHKQYVVRNINVLAQHTHTDLSRTTVKQNISYVHYMTILQWFVPILIPSRTTNKYRHYNDNRKILTLIIWNILLVLNICQCFSHNKYIRILLGECL